MIFASSKRAVPRSSRSITSLTLVPASSGAICFSMSLKNLVRYTFRTQDALLAARELEHLALHRADHVELLQDEARVLGRCVVASVAVAISWT